MTNTLLNGVSTIAVQAILTILGLAVTYLITVVVSYLNKKKQAVIKQMGVDQYNANYNLSSKILLALEQQFKFIPSAGALKAAAFDKLLLNKVPGLTQDEIDHFRESVVGEFNTQINKTNLLAPAYDPSKDEADVKPTEQTVI